MDSANWARTRTIAGAFRTQNALVSPNQQEQPMFPAGNQQMIGGAGSQLVQKNICKGNLFKRFKNHLRVGIFWGKGQNMTGKNHRMRTVVKGFYLLTQG